MNCSDLFDTFRIRQDAFFDDKTPHNQALARDAYHAYVNCIKLQEQRMGRPVMYRTLGPDDIDELYKPLRGGRKKTMRRKFTMRRRKTPQKFSRRRFY